MKKYFAVLAICIPLGLAGFFITNNILTSTFPIFRSESFNEEQTILETYESGLEFCKANYENRNVLVNVEYENCVNSVESWYEENKK